MARGQSAISTKQLGITNQLGQTEQGQAESLESQLTPAYSSLMNTGYFSPAQQNAATTSTMGAATAPFGAAKFDAANRAAATRNPADLTAQTDELALEQGRTAGTAAADLQNQQMQNQMAGAYGLTGLEQGNQQTMAQMYGLGPSTLQARAAGLSGDQIAQGYLGLGVQGGQDAAQDTGHG
jgi:hypothetical protein